MLLKNDDYYILIIYNTMENIIYNLFLVNNIDLIEDIQNVIKNTLLSRSMIKIIPPTLEECPLYENGNLTFEALYNVSYDENIKMSISTYRSTNIYYNIGISNIILDFKLDLLNMNKVYIKSDLSNGLQLLKDLLQVDSQWISFTIIQPIYYFP